MLGTYMLLKQAPSFVPRNRQLQISESHFQDCQSKLRSECDGYVGLGPTPRLLEVKHRVLQNTVELAEYWQPQFELAVSEARVPAAHGDTFA